MIELELWGIGAAYVRVGFIPMSGSWVHVMVMETPGSSRWRLGAGSLPPQWVIGTKFPAPGWYRHLGSEPRDGNAFSCCLSLFLSFPLSFPPFPWNKWINNEKLYCSINVFKVWSELSSAILTTANRNY